MAMAPCANGCRGGRSSALVKDPLDGAGRGSLSPMHDGKDHTGGDGMALDVEGNLYITTNLGVEIFSDRGKHRGLVRFPEQPANVTLGGPDGKTMYVTARTGLYRVRMPIAGLKPN